jgi:hypothetical protein
VHIHMSLSPSLPLLFYRQLLIYLNISIIMSLSECFNYNVRGLHSSVITWTLNE